MPVQADPIVARIQRVLPATAERVYRAWTDPDELAAWAWGEGRNAHAEIDLRVGGTYRVAIPADPAVEDWEGDSWAMTGMYAEIVPGRRLIYSVHWDAPVGYNQTGARLLDEMIDVRFEDGPNGCVVEHVHMGVPEFDAAQAHLTAVDQTLDILARLVADAS